MRMTPKLIDAIQEKYDVIDRAVSNATHNFYHSNFNYDYFFHIEVLVSFW